MSNGNDSKGCLILIIAILAIGIIAVLNMSANLR